MTLPEILAQALGSTDGNTGGPPLGGGLGIDEPIVTITTSNASGSPHMSSLPSGMQLESIPLGLAGPLMGSPLRQDSALEGVHNINEEISHEIARAENEPSSSEPLENRGKGKSAEDVAKLAEIYESFELDPIWDKLSKVLTRLEGDPSAAQILLPSIEVSKWTCERNSRRFSY